MKQIASALVKAQKEFGPALKSSTNPHFKSKYADLAACIEAVVDALNNNGIALVQQLSECDSGVIVETLFIHESGEIFNCGKIHIPAVKHDAQGFGSALTYARRYSVMAACGIAPEDDDGNAAVKKKKPEIDESKMVDHLSAIDASPTAEDLKITFTEAYQFANGDIEWQKKIIARKDARKKALAEGQG